MLSSAFPSVALPLVPILKKVSRSFYLSLRILPRRSRGPFALAYLLARAADTVADTELVPAERRLEELGHLKAALESLRAPASHPPSVPGDGFVAIAPRNDGRGAIPEEQALLDQLPALLAWYRATDPADRRDIATVVGELIEGMEEDVRRFPGGAGQPVRALATEAELERYCHLAAGVVGPFWTRLLWRHEPSLARLDRAALERLGEAFGRGLQKINVLKDIAKDYRIGRCYLPAEWLSAAGLTPAELGSPDVLPRLRPVLARLTESALDGLEAGQRYVASLPRRCVCHRLAVLWPLWIGLATLQHLAADPALLDASRPHKISRSTLRRLLFRSWFAAPSNRRLERHFQAARFTLKKSVKSPQ